jgi:flagellar protein FlbT
MALVIDLKPEEKLIVGSTVITNDSQRTRLRIDGDAPILREKDTMTEEEATTPAKKLYLSIQKMYLQPADTALNGLDDYYRYFESIRTLAPHISDFLNDISQHILQGTYYKALKSVQDLMNFEAEGKEPEANQPQAEKDMSSNKMEAQMLSQAAEQLQQLYDNWDETPEPDRETIISYNRKLWMVFFDGAKTNTPQAAQGFDVTANITHLYNFIHRRSGEILKSGDKESLKTLIFINTQAATALQRAAV